jgi:hypothetical protein
MAGPARSRISHHEVRFTGTAGFHDNGTAYRVLAPDQPQYVGDDMLETEKAWNELIDGKPPLNKLSAA